MQLVELVELAAAEVELVHRVVARRETGLVRGKQLAAPVEPAYADHRLDFIVFADLCEDLLDTRNPRLRIGPWAYVDALEE